MRLDRLGINVFYRINEVTTVAATGNTYAHVDFWRRKSHFDRGDSPYLTNDFIVTLRPMNVIRKREDGFFEKKDGSYIDVAEARVTPYGDFRLYDDAKSSRQIILDQILGYWDKALKERWVGDHTGDHTKPFRNKNRLVVQTPTSPIVRDTSDPNRVLEQTNVTDLRGREQEETRSLR